MNQPVAMDLESVGVVELLTGSGEVVEKGYTVSIHEVRTHAVMSTYITHIMDLFRCRISKPETYRLQVGTPFVVFCRCHQCRSPFQDISSNLQRLQYVRLWNYQCLSS